jgi:hypothetical protein
MAKTPVKQQTTAESTALAERDPSTSLSNVPDFLKDSNTVRGSELIEAADMLMPRLALCQSNTPQRKPQNPLFIEGLQEGQFFNTLSRRIYGDEVTFIPLFFYRSRIMFKDIDEGGGVLCQAPDGHSCQLNHGGPCINSAWGANGEPPACTELYNFPALIKLEREPYEFAVISLKSTAIKAAKSLNSMIKLRKKDAFAGLYLLQAVPDHKQGQDFWGHTISNAGWVTPVEYEYAQQQYEALAPKVKTGEITIDHRGMGNDDEAFADRDAQDVHAATNEL